jgi:hypothetical protein
MGTVHCQVFWDALLMAETVMLMMCRNTMSVQVNYRIRDVKGCHPPTMGPDGACAISVQQVRLLRI